MIFNCVRKINLKCTDDKPNKNHNVDCVDLDLVMFFYAFEGLQKRYPNTDRV